MSKKNGELPPNIMELLKKKGWTWPPTEEMKKQWKEADERLCGCIHVDPENWEELAESFPDRFPIPRKRS